MRSSRAQLKLPSPSIAGRSRAVLLSMIRKSGVGPLREDTTASASHRRLERRRRSSLADGSSATGSNSSTSRASIRVYSFACGSPRRVRWKNSRRA